MMPRIAGERDPVAAAQQRDLSLTGSMVDPGTDDGGDVGGALRDATMHRFCYLLPTGRAYCVSNAQAKAACVGAKKRDGAGESPCSVSSNTCVVERGLGRRM